jgi:integrase
MATGKLLQHFDPNKPIAEITAADALAWKYWLETHLATNTWRKFAAIVKQLFAYACAKQYIERNPFECLRGLRITPNETTETYVPMSHVRMLLDVMPLEWKVLFSLVRLCALRCPSEVTGLTWQDVNWEKHTLFVRSPKTQRTGAAARIVPMFETRQFLAELFEVTQPGALYLFPQYAGKSHVLKILTAHLRKYYKLCGLPMPKRPWQNLRRSAVIDLSARFPSFAVTRWCGHSLAVSQQHYLRVCDELLQQASCLQRLSPTQPTQSVNRSGNDNACQEAQTQDTDN